MKITAQIAMLTATVISIHLAEAEDVSNRTYELQSAKQSDGLPSGSIEVKGVTNLIHNLKDFTDFTESLPKGSIIRFTKAPMQWDWMALGTNTETTFLELQSISESNGIPFKTTSIDSWQYRDKIDQANKSLEGTLVPRAPSD